MSTITAFMNGGEDYALKRLANSPLRFSTSDSYLDRLKENANPQSERPQQVDVSGVSENQKL
jgi:hypothetical protein